MSSIYDSPVGIARIPARRERDLLCRRVLGQIVWPDGELKPGAETEKKEAREWLMRYR